MNAILGWLAILDSGKPIKDVYSALSVIRRNAQLQATLIEDLLDMNRLISGSMHLEVEPTDLGVLLHATLQSLQPSADARGVQLIASVDSATGKVPADPRRLQQVLWNLVNNAIKFTPSGGRVEIRVQRLGSSVQLVVEDNGQGIEPSFLPHVFERFRQQDSSSTRSTYGLGLGLSIAKHLVELHGGSIAASSEGAGRGATFLVHLPAMVAAAREAGAGTGSGVISA